MSAKNLIIVPMKDPVYSKSRLKGHISDDFRRRLSLTLFNQTLIKLRRTILSLEKQFDLAVVTESDEIDNLSELKSVKVIRCLTTKSLSGYLDYAARWAKDQRYASLCIVPADLANPKLSDLEKLLSYPIVKNEMVICPAKDLGTNALFISPPDTLRFSFGKKSFVRHLRSAERKHIKSVILPLESIKQDLDTTDDLNLFLKEHPKFVGIGTLNDKSN